jgi:hypothetical protein
MTINSRLLACKAEIGQALYYAKLALRVDPYFQVLALIKLMPTLALKISSIQIISTNNNELTNQTRVANN